MSEGTKQIRLSKVVKEFNVGLSTVIEFLAKKGFNVNNNPNTKISEEIYDVLVKEYQSEKVEKEKSRQIGLSLSTHETISLKDDVIKPKTPTVEEKIPEKEELIIRGNITIDNKTSKVSASPKTEKVAKKANKTEKSEKDPKSQKSEKDSKSQKTEKIQNPQKIETSDSEIININDDKTDDILDKIKSDTDEVVLKENIVENLDKEKQESSTGLKVLGKINLEELENKGSSRSKSKTKSKAKTDKSAKKLSKSEIKDETKEINTKETKTEDVKTEEILSEVKPDVNVDKKQEIKDNSDFVVDSDNNIAEPIEKTQKIKKVTTAVNEEDVKDDLQAELKQQDAETNEVISKPDIIISEVVEEIPEAKTDDSVSEELKLENEKPDNFLKTNYIELNTPKILGKIKLDEKEPSKKDNKKKQLVGSSQGTGGKKFRKRIKKDTKEPIDAKKPDTQSKDNWKNRQKNKSTKKTTKVAPPVIDDEMVQQHIKETLAKLTSTSKSKSAKHRREKRQFIHNQQQAEQLKMVESSKIIQVTEFCTANDLANMMNIPVASIINTCLNLGLFVSINQRLDAEVIEIVASEFDFKVEFVSADVQDSIGEDNLDNPNDLVPRAPIVTVMGHVDHGKTSLLDYIRKSNVIAGEAGGITQHIGAYEFVLESGKKITFLDTPGHEAFTAMRARGAKITDVAIIIIAADDAVMPQTKEAINHVMAAGVPVVFAINKIDKPNANPDKIKEELARMNILVEDWDGKYQCQEISAKKGVNVDLLLEKVLLEAELMDLKGNPNKPALGTVIESSLDKGRGYVTKVLVQNGSLKIGDIVLAGYHYGRVKAMYNERNQKVNIAGPSTPVLLLGLNGAPQAGDRFNVMCDEKETKAIANKRMQLQREQGLRTQKHITLDEIGRRIAIGDFKELNIIVKGDVDGSVEALSDSILKLSSNEVQVNVIHKSVGAVTESDVLLASASNAVIIGFQVRPTLNARKLAEQEQIDIRLYSIIYSAINELKAAIEGMLSPDIEEKIIGNIEVREVFKISKVGAVAGCIVLDGKLNKSTNIRVIRDGIVVYSGQLSSLKRFKDDVKEVQTGYECGLSIHNFNDIKVGDIIEGYEEVEVKRKL